MISPPTGKGQAPGTIGRHQAARIVGSLDNRKIKRQLRCFRPAVCRLQRDLQAEPGLHRDNHDNISQRYFGTGCGFCGRGGRQKDPRDWCYCGWAGEYYDDHFHQGPSVGCLTADAGGRGVRNLSGHESSQHRSDRGVALCVAKSIFRQTPKLAKIKPNPSL